MSHDANLKENVRDERGMLIFETEVLKIATHRDEKAVCREYAK